MKNKGFTNNGNLILFSCLFLLLAAAFALSVCTGKYEISVRDIFALLSGAAEDDMQRKVLFTLRIPRTATCVMAGAGLGVAGYVYQTVFKNPLASPDVIGIAGGANLGAAISLVSISSSSMIAIATGAFWGGLLAVGCVFLLVRATASNSMATFVIAGIIINAVTKAVIMALKYFADPENELAAMEYWEMGTFGNTTLSKLIAVLPMFIIGMAGVILLRRQVMMMALSDAECRALGVRLKLMRPAVLLLSTLIVASIICITGLISFIGLIAPHVSRLMIKKEGTATMMASALVGAVVILLADVCARSLYSAELPVSILTTAIGVPLLVYFLCKRGRGRI